MEYGNKQRTIWLVAHSNVAVKNIAEKLDKVGFREFKVLVSKDYHNGWHEHLYERLEHCFIRSELFHGKQATINQLLLDTRVVLCTLSMLSNSELNKFANVVPIHTVIFDEASQIEVGDYLPLLHRFRHSLQKLVFIGDDKQHRMPVVIGNFISHNVYNRLLKTDHNIDSRSACRFLDVEKGQEKMSGKSWTNEPEIAVIIHLARLYHGQGKEYKIITPYDAQRNAIERQLRSAKVPVEDKCFNVDSFQGKQSDHIIVSLVRSEGVGFLTNVRRMNVMLTRCKKSMIICTNRKFVTAGTAANTLVGKLAAAMGPEGWLDSRDIVRGVLP
ncbi:hypothetical protein M405DRAFT_751348 [Rhizopogon salebrosus TDB-379]|nr:hypothetical protein M405DRAFT_751348 [Rhizopogon salebrosus TDB-379]